MRINRTFVMRVFLLGLVLAVPVAVPVAVQTLAGDYVWVGLANDNDSRWTIQQNWDQNDNYPRFAEDSATIDDPTNFAGLVTANAAYLVIGELFVGDGHTIELDDHVSVNGPLELDGVVVVSDAQEGEWEMNARVISINTTQRTTLTFADGDGDGCIYTIGLADACTSNG